MAGYATGMGQHADIFLKIDGVEGESTDQKHSGEIEVLSWSYGATQPGSATSGGGAGVGKVQLHDFTISKYHDKATPKLFEACTTGKHFPQIKLTCRKAGGDQQEYLVITLKEVLVSNIAISHSGGDARPIENISMNYATVEMDYAAQDKDGTLKGHVKSGWDAKKNVKI